AEWPGLRFSQVGGSEPFGALLDVVLHRLVFLERLETAALDGREVHEHVFGAVVRSDVAETLRVVKPFDLTGTHVLLPLIDLELYCLRERQGRKTTGEHETNGDCCPTSSLLETPARPLYTVMQ